MECRRVIEASTREDLLRRESSSWEEEETKEVAESLSSLTCSTIRLTSSSTSMASIPKHTKTKRNEMEKKEKGGWGLFRCFLN